MHNRPHTDAAKTKMSAAHKMRVFINNRIRKIVEELENHS